MQWSIAWHPFSSDPLSSSGGGACFPPPPNANVAPVGATQSQGADSYDLDLVFCDPQGNYLKPDSISAKVCGIAQKARLSNVNLHTLRHSHGSQLLSSGVPLPAVSKRLGHSSVFVTATVYSHALSVDETTAAEKWDAATRAALQVPIARKIS